MKVVKLGVMTGMYDPATYSDIAQEAESIGFESFWVPEHLVLPIEMAGRPGTPGVEDGTVDDHPHLPSETPLFDPLLALAHIAAHTSRIVLGTAVLVLALRPPIAMARALLTLDLLSAGRLQVGVGAGWLRSEWEAAGVPFEDRGARLEESVEVCRRLWTEDVVRHDGRFSAFGPVRFEPKPASVGGPPILFGGMSKIARDRAGRVGDGWIPMSSQNPAALAPAIEEIHEIRTRLGRRDAPFEISVPVREACEIEAWVESGLVDRVIVGGGLRDANDTLRQMRLARSWIE